uniref:Integrase catalytic domain-containing protein n=1 Tax=Tanacetum cinerariifolium TaxID=118510 RepID=A0A6L2LKQ7_TANCI|nr:hypothetical protein [Tanacetum cinerariifolium]
MTIPNPQRHVAPTAVLTQSKLVPVTVVRPVTTIVPKTNVTRPRHAKTVVNKPHSPPKRHINRSPSPKASTFPLKVTAARASMVNAAKGMCDKKHNVLFTDTECIVLSPEFKLTDENQVLLRVPRENNMYNVDLKNIVPSGDLTYLFAKETLDKYNLWHRRLGHINFKTMNKLVKGNLVRGLLTKVVENNHTCVACKKGNQHRASCKTNHVSSVNQPLQRLHMDLFGPTFVKSINKKSYCLVVTDDYSGFTWVFLATKDETSLILKTFITSIENQLSLKVKIIKSDNGTEFQNHDLNQLCRMKGIKREFSVARASQQNGIAKRKNKTLIKAVRTMLADSLLPIPFWAKAVNTAYYVQNRVLVTKPYNKTPYELLHSRTPSIGFMRPFGCPVTVLNTLDSLGKFDGKVDEGFLVGYSVSSKAFRVFNSRTRIVQETLHINFLENKPNDAEKAGEEYIQQYVLFPVWSSGFTNLQNTDGNAAFEKKEPKFERRKPESEVHVSLSSSAQIKKHDDKTNREAKGKIPAVGKIYTNSTNTFSVVGPFNAVVSPTHGKSLYMDVSQLPDDLNMPELEDITYSDDKEDVGAKADFTNLETTITVTTQTRSMTRVAKDQGGLSQIHNDDFHTCMFACFLSQEEPKRVHQALKDPSWIEAMHEELFQFKMQKVWVLVDLPNGKRVIEQTQEEGIDYEEVFALVARIEAIRLLLAYTSFMGSMVYQMDVKGTFLYETIEEKVYVCQPLGFEDPDYPDKVYKVIKALYGLHQAPRAWYETLANYLLENGFQRGKIDQTLFIKRQQGELTFFLGLQVKQKPNGIFICQDKYVAEILRKFGLTDGKSASTPIDTEKPLLKNPDVVATSSTEAEYVATASCCVNDVSRLQSLVDKKKVIITEATIRDALRLVDAEGIDWLPNEEIFTELAQMGYEKPSTKLTFYKAFFSPQWKFLIHTILQCMSAKKTSWNEFSSSMASAVICLSTGRKFNFSKYIFDGLVRTVDSPTKFYMYPQFIKLMIRAQVGDLPSHSTKYSSPALTQKVFANMRRVGKGFSGANTPLFEVIIVAHEVGEGAAEVDVEDVPTAGVAAEGAASVADDDDAEMLMDLLHTLLDTCTTLTRRVENLEQDKIAQALEITKLKQRVKKLERRNKLKVSKLRRLKKVGTTQRIDTSDDTIMDDIDLEHAEKVLSMQDKESEPAELQKVVKVVTTAKLITEVVTAASVIITATDTLIPAATITAAAPTLTTAPSAARKRKGEVIKDPEETTTQSTIIHTEPKSKDKGKRIMVHVPKPLKKKTQIEQDEAYAREKPQTEAQARKNTMIYLSNMIGFKMDYFKGMSYDDIRPIFKKYFNSNVAFLEKTKEQMEEEDSKALKRISESQEDKAAKGISWMKRLKS